MSRAAAVPTSRFFTAEGLRLHYLDWGGEAERPTLVLVHGNRDHAHSWDGTARALADRFRVVALDLRGHGDSAWSPDGAYLLAYHFLDLLALLDALGPAPVAAVGHSFGGNVVARCAALAPERFGKLVLVDGLGANPRQIAAWDAAGPLRRTREWIGRRRDPRNDHPRRFATLDDAVVRMAEAHPHLSPAQARELTEQGVRGHSDGYGWKYDPRVSMFMPEDFACDASAFWRAIRSPTLLCYGTESWTLNPEQDPRTEAFADKRVAIFAGAGHWLHHDRPDAFVAALRDFL